MKNDHSTDENQQKLLDELPPPEEFLFVNSRCCISEQDQIRVVVVNGTPVYRYVRGDIVAEDLFVAQALSSGHAYPVAACNRDPAKIGVLPLLLKLPRMNLDYSLMLTPVLTHG